MNLFSVFIIQLIAAVLWIIMAVRVPAPPAKTIPFIITLL